MNEQQWNEYSLMMARNLMNAGTAASITWFNGHGLQAHVLAPENFYGMQNTCPPLVVTDRVWNEDIW